MSSGGKDSLVALARLRGTGVWDVRGLLVHLDEGERTLATHGVPEALLDAQAASLGLPLEKVFLPRHPSNGRYEAAIGGALSAFWDHGVRHMAFGDLFLTDIRSYRDELLAKLDMTAVYPVWGEAPRALTADIAATWRALVVCVDEARLDPGLAGRAFDEAFLAALPAGIDPCGETGEFHTFVTDGPGFAFPLPVRVAGHASDGRYTRAVLTLDSMERCGACGAPFACGVRTTVAPCWCTRLPPVEVVDPAAGCLCPRCLAARVPVSASSSRAAPRSPAS